MIAYNFFKNTLLKYREIVVILSLFILAFIIRFHNLSLIAINFDESRWAMGILHSPETMKKFLGIPLNFFPYSLQPLLGHISSPAQLANFNDLIFFLRFRPVAAGALTVILTYILARQMYGKRVGLISAVLLCFLPWHIIQSRIMGGAISVPFWSALIFLSLFQAIQVKGNGVYSMCHCEEGKARRGNLVFGLWILFVCFPLKWAIRDYQVSILFIPALLIALICLRSEIGQIIGRKTVLVLILTALLLAMYLVYKVMIEGHQLCQFTYHIYQDDIYKSDLLYSLFKNLKHNFTFAYDGLFFDFKGSFMLYGEALKAPLLVHPLTAIFFIISFLFSLFQRKPADKIILVWFCVGFLGGLAGADVFLPRYILVSLVPFMIIIGKFIGTATKKIAVPIILCCGLIIIAFTQWLAYNYVAPYDLDQYWGCKEASEYLSQIPNIDKENIFSDNFMSVDMHLDYFLFAKGKAMGYNNWQRRGSEGYYIFWAPESHPMDYWDGVLRRCYEAFKSKNPDKMPIKIIHYPNGIPAIYIFKI